jgi:AcrR family transcriptional regulator
MLVSLLVAFLLPSFDEESFRFILRIMKTAALHTFEPRKTPVQKRSTVTVEAIAEATIQVLLVVGLNRLTTTRVADRAGVSVGTLYQYYPNKQALLYAVLEAHSIKVVEAVEHACRANRGAAVKVLVAAVVEAFINAKLERTDISTALYAAAAEPEGAAVVRRLSKRVHRALTAALADAAGTTLGDMEFVALMLYSAMAGATRAVLEAGAPPKMVVRLHKELLVLCQRYAAKSVGSS